MSAKPEVLNERAAILLKKLVHSYISDGQPVGSKRLAHDAGLDISSATIRNVLSMLEKKGLVTITPRKGTFVKRIARKDIQENFPRCLLHQFFLR